MSTAKEVLEAVKNQRVREEAVDALRRRTKRSIPVGICYFAFALFYLWQGYHEGLSKKIDGENVVLVGGAVSWGVALIWIFAAIEKISVNPTDKFLLLFAEDMQARQEKPRQQ